MSRFVTLKELNAGIPAILESPPDRGFVKGIVIRPDHGDRLEPESCEISRENGVLGDHWSKGCWKSTKDGLPHPDVQICMMNAVCISLIAQERQKWAYAGDNFFVDINLAQDSLPIGQRLRVGDAVIEITDTPHLGCAGFISHYGKDACVFVNSKEGRRLRLRGVYARVIRDGLVAVGDQIMKVDG